MTYKNWIFIGIALCSLSTLQAQAQAQTAESDYEVKSIPSNGAVAAVGSITKAILDRQNELLPRIDSLVRLNNGRLNEFKVAAAAYIDLISQLKGLIQLRPTFAELIEADEVVKSVLGIVGKSIGAHQSKSLTTEAVEDMQSRIINSTSRLTSKLSSVAAESASMNLGAIGIAYDRNLGTHRIIFEGSHADNAKATFAVVRVSDDFYVDRPLNLLVSHIGQFESAIEKFKQNGGKIRCNSVL